MISDFKYYIQSIFYFIRNIIDSLKFMIFMYQYKRHLIMRIEKNNFGRNEEW